MAFLGIDYECNSLLFGYSLAPRTFSKWVNVALQPLHDQDMRVLFHLEDLIVMAKSSDWAIFHTAKLVLTKPRQQVDYLGVMLNLISLRAILLEPRWTALQQAVLRLWRGVTVE